ncbi:MAG: DNA polymerase ligase N-terminal domain-containing protein [Longimicrobiales bacterium]|nr:DNA polymerase ligase N-terminal domain-containing protein [Longimicrobiales bacterium]
MSESTQEYEGKRDFRKTGEPAADGERPSDLPDPPLWVIQEHDASSHHFDFRLEADGVLKSWAVPKGPSTDPSDKRLALPTEDHPIEYADFEGVIAEEEYGGGTVIVWDRGTYTNLKEDDDGEPVRVADQVADGHVTVRLEGGRKLAGGYALTRMEGRDEEMWLLVKMDDEEADARRNPVSTEPESVKTGRTVDQVAAEEAGDRAGGDPGGGDGSDARDDAGRGE